ncbi:hypothetical protein PRIPAC_95431 [Pristionchus pacificus]|uniref:G protein-coupled receptor n=1 Tax=Pristionchus pacificus TaxID=54126 RepID=A0A2A6BK84_PRIPA|nr:hypothetical protein PRIPAC_95431 [Pristionchus pacificus]|eukprot:PDM66201.1 G protein-coupled receptor [Pristionchus pacificus]
MDDQAHPVYQWIITGPFHTAFFIVMGVISVVSSSALILSIYASRSSEIGAYRYLILCFAVGDIVTSIMHAVALPHLHMTSTGYWYLPRNDWIFFSKGGIVVLVVTFVYIASRSCFDRFRPITWVALSTVIYVLYMGALFGVSLYALMPSDYSRSVAPRFFIDLYGMDASDPNSGYLLVTLKRLDAEGNLSWHAPTLIALSVAGTLLAGTAAAIFLCICLINAHMKTLSFAPKTRKLQRQLYKVLLIQTSVPCVFCYIPLAIMLFLPLTGADIGSFGTILVMITAIFPSIEGLIVILMIPLFRRAILRFLHIAFETKMTFYMANPAKVSSEINTRGSIPRI